MRYIAAFLCALCAQPVAAQDMMSAAEFDAYTRGKTLFYGRGGDAYGAEIYHENRRVQWSFLDGVCKEGEWYEEAGLICFVYEDNPDPQCWSFVEGTRGLIARFDLSRVADDFWNYFVIMFQSIQNLLVFGYLFMKGKIRLENDIFFIMIIYCALFSITPIFGPRYLYPVSIWAILSCCKIEDFLVQNKSLKSE